MCGRRGGTAPIIHLERVRVVVCVVMPHRRGLLHVNVIQKALSATQYTSKEDLTTHLTVEEVHSMHKLLFSWQH